jgi:hypothetical protein
MVSSHPEKASAALRQTPPSRACLTNNLSTVRAWKNARCALYQVQESEYSVQDCPKMHSLTFSVLFATAEHEGIMCTGYSGAAWRYTAALE